VTGDHTIIDGPQQLEFDGTVMHVRADRLSLDDVLLLELLGTTRLERVTRLELIGDDVEVNGTLVTSRSNTLPVVVTP
jgi:hypothetical protein